MLFYELKSISVITLSQSNFQRQLFSSRLDVVLHFFHAFSLSGNQFWSCNLFWCWKWALNISMNRHLYFLKFILQLSFYFNGAISVETFNNGWISYGNLNIFAIFHQSFILSNSSEALHALNYRELISAGIFSCGTRLEYSY